MGTCPNQKFICLASRASWVAVDIGFAKLLVLSTLPNSTICLDTRPAVPVNVGLSIGAFEFRAVCVAVDTGFEEALVVVSVDSRLLTCIARNLLSLWSNNLLVFVAGTSPNRTLCV